MKAALLDVNVLIALAWPSHVQHEAAHVWFAAHSRRGWATCPMTQCGFVRISSNPKIIADAVTPFEAIAMLRAIVALRGHEFWPDAFSLEDPGVFVDLGLGGHRQIGDAYLLSLAVRKGGKFATFDQGIPSLVKPESAESRAIVLIPAI
jgi:toxin-antitoxin system PIN domain toxin